MKHTRIAISIVFLFVSLMLIMTALQTGRVNEPRPKADAMPGCFHYVGTYPVYNASCTGAIVPGTTGNTTYSLTIRQGIDPVIASATNYSYELYGPADYNTYCGGSQSGIGAPQVFPPIVYPTLPPGRFEHSETFTANCGSCYQMDFNSSAGTCGAVFCTGVCPAGSATNTPSPPPPTNSPPPGTTNTPVPTEPPGVPQCNPAALTMGVAPGSVATGANITFSLSGSEGSLHLSDSFSGGVSCPGFPVQWPTQQTCTANTQGSFTWTHRWRVCNGDPSNLNNCSSECSRVANYTVTGSGATPPTETPVPPTATGVPPTPTRTSTPTSTPSRTPTQTPTRTPTPTFTPTRTPTSTPTQTPTRTPTNTPTNTPTRTPTQTPTPTRTPTQTPTRTPTPVPTATLLPGQPTYTPTPTYLAGQPTNTLAPGQPTNTLAPGQPTYTLAPGQPTYTPAPRCDQSCGPCGWRGSDNICRDGQPPNQPPGGLICCISGTPVPPTAIPTYIAGQPTNTLAPGQPTYTPTPSGPTLTPTPYPYVGGFRCDQRCGICGISDTGGVCQDRQTLPDNSVCCHNSCVSNSCAKIFGIAADVCTSDAQCVGVPTTSMIASSPTPTPPVSGIGVPWLLLAIPAIIIIVGLAL